MKAWILTASTLVLAVIASTAQAQVMNTKVAVNNSDNRKILIEWEDNTWRHMVWEMADTFPQTAGFPDAPAYYLRAAGILCPGPVPFFDEFWADLDLQSGLRYALYLTVGKKTRRILSFNPHCSQWSSGNPLTGTYASHGYLMDGIDWDQSFWRDQMMNDEVIVEVKWENPKERFEWMVFYGVIPPVVQ
jgi:hypothetical protein